MLKIYNTLNNIYKIILDAFDFFVHDPDTEKQYSFNLKNTILRARHRRVFEVSS